MDNPRVTITIMNWNGADDTIACIESVMQNVYKDYDIIVIDNGSDNNDANKIRDKFGKKITIIENDKNYGSSIAANKGIKYILENLDSEYIIILENDTVVDKYFLEELVSHAKKSGADIISSVVYYYDNPEKVHHSFDKMWFWRGIILPIGFLIRDNTYKVDHYNMIENVDLVAFRCTMIRKEIFEGVGLFDEDFFWSYENVDFCARVLRAGKKITYAPRSKVWHKCSSNSRNDSSIHYYGTRNKFLLMKRFIPTWQYYSFVVYMFLIHSIFTFMYHVILKWRFNVFVNFCKGLRDGIQLKTGKLE